MVKDPRVTLVVFSYNQEQYIAEALDGALAQTYPHLEILISDDCSTDETFGIITSKVSDYCGPHQIKINRNEKNLNIGGHVRRVAKIAQGDIVVMAAGDDVSISTRVEEIVKVFNEQPDVFATYSDMIAINEKSESVGCMQYDCISIGNPGVFSMLRKGGGVATGASYAYRKRCFNWPWDYPEFYTAEDRLLPLRASILGKVVHIRKNLVRYRASSTGTFRKVDPSVSAPPYCLRCAEEVGKTILYANEIGKIGFLRTFIFMYWVNNFTDFWRRMYEWRNGKSMFLKFAERFLCMFLYLDHHFCELAKKIRLLRGHMSA